VLGGCVDNRVTSRDAALDAPNDSDAMGAVRNPYEIFGRDLFLWLDADNPSSIITDGDGGVSRWTSETDYGGEFIATYPLLARNGITIEPLAANGHPAVRVGAQRGMLEALGSSWAINWFTVVAVVAAYKNDASQPGVLFMMPKVDFYMRGNAMGKSVVMGGAGGGAVWSAAEGWNDGKFHTFGFRTGADDVGGAAIRADGVQWGQVGPIGASGDSPVMIAGHHCAPCDAGPTAIEEPLEGYIAEVVMANISGTSTGAAQLAQVAQLSAYFQKKYGIPF
jgi:hypothetical protein